MRVGRKSDVGIGPLKRFMLKSRYTKFESDSSPPSGPHSEFADTDRYPRETGIFFGNVPEKPLFFKSKWSNPAGNNSEGGSVPTSLFEESTRTFSSTKREMLLHGIEPDNMLWLRSRVWRLGKVKMDSGMEPVSRLLVMEMTRRFFRFPS